MRGEQIREFIKGPALSQLQDVIERLWLTIVGVFCSESGTAGSSGSLSAAIHRVDLTGRASQ